MRPITFKQYDPQNELNWEIATAEKGMRYSIRRAVDGSEILLLPYGLRPEEKSFARMMVSVPEMVLALKQAKDFLNNPKRTQEDADEVYALISTVLDMAH